MTIDTGYPAEPACEHFISVSLEEYLEKEGKAHLLQLDFDEPHDEFNLLFREWSAFVDAQALTGNLWQSADDAERNLTHV